MNSWVWIDPDVLLSAHDEQLQAHGGVSGIRDPELFQSVLQRPQDLAGYDGSDAARLAAAYAFALARNSALVNGNERTALVALELFLVLNGFALVADDAQCVLATLSAASGAFSEFELAEWIRNHAKPA